MRALWMDIKVVKKFGTGGAHILIPGKYAGKKARVEVIDESFFRD